MTTRSGRRCSVNVFSAAGKSTVYFLNRSNKKVNKGKAREPEFDFELVKVRKSKKKKESGIVIRLRSNSANWLLQFRGDTLFDECEKTFERAMERRKLLRQQGADNGADCATSNGA